MKNTILFLLFPVLALISCDTTKRAGSETMNATSKTEKPTAVASSTPVAITYKTGPCMGKCPVFTLSISKDGNTSFFGRKYAPRQGEHTKTLGMSALRQIQTLVADADWWNLEDTYDSGILDAPTNYITVKSGDKEKKISFRGEMPEKVQTLKAMLDQVVLSEGWNAVEVKPDLTKSWTYEQGPCFGKCPVFSMSVNSEGLVSYEGKRFSEKQGVHTKTVPPTTLDELTKLFEEANWWKMENSYDSGISDVSQITIGYRDSDMIKKIRFRGESPGNVKEIKALFNKIANSEGWTKVSSTDYGLPPGTIANELIIKLKEGQNIDKFVQSYIKQDMKLKKNIAPTMNLHLVSFDPGTMTPQEMLESVKARKEVESVEFNKEVGIRD